MSEEYQRTNRKAPSMRAGAKSSDQGRSANKARSYRAETYNPDDPNRIEPETVYLNNVSYSAASEEEKESGSSPISGIKEKISSIFASIGSGKDKESKREPGSGSRYKQEQAKAARRNDLIKKGFLALIALVIIILVITLIVSSSQVKDVGSINITSTATTQTLDWSGARKGLSYEIYRAEGANGAYQLIETLTDGENSKSYDNLTPGTLYRYKIVTVKSNGSRTEGTVSESYTKPNAVTGTSASTTKENALTAFWKLQGNTAEYELKYSLYDNLRDADVITFTSDQADYNSTSDTYSYTIDNLVLGENYYLSMRTVCDDSTSEWSAVFNSTVTESADLTGLDASVPMVALTFDGGPDGGDVTTRILDVLAKYDSKATFFQTGVHAEEYPELMQRIVSEGHEMGNHTYDESHVGGEVTADDIIDANKAIENACGVYPKLFRAPQGNVTDAIVDCCTDEGMAIVLWDFDSHDWEIYDPDEIIERIEAYVESGDIIQFRNIYDETATAIETLVPYLVDQGYKLVTVSQMVQSNTGSLPIAGRVYTSAVDSYEYPGD